MQSAAPYNYYFYFFILKISRASHNAQMRGFGTVRTHAGAAPSGERERVPGLHAGCTGGYLWEQQLALAM